MSSFLDFFFVSFSYILQNILQQNSVWTDPKGKDYMSLSCDFETWQD